MEIAMIIDRFEAGVAVVENDDDEMIDIPRERLPITAAEGDVIKPDGDGYCVDLEATRLRRERIAARMARLAAKTRAYSENTDAER